MVLTLAVALSIPVSTSAMAAENEGETLPTVDFPAAQIFSCGGGFTFMSVAVSSHGNIVRFESPAGQEHYDQGIRRSGYQLCWFPGGPAIGSPVFDFGEATGSAPVAESNLGAASVAQPLGPNRFPLEITRTVTGATGAVLRITRRITGNSFIMPAAAGDPGGFDINNNGQLCDTLQECGNCTNRTIHVLTRVTNLTGTARTVTVAEMVDVDASFNPGSDRASRTNDSFTIHQDYQDTPGDAYGILLQSLITPAFASIHPFAGYDEGNTGPPADCAAGFSDGAPLPTPTAGIDVEGVLFQTISVPAFSTNSGSIRIHHRRY